MEKCFVGLFIYKFAILRVTLTEIQASMNLMPRKTGKQQMDYRAAQGEIIHIRGYGF